MNSILQRCKKEQMRERGGREREREGERGREREREGERGREKKPEEEERTLWAVRFRNNLEKLTF